MLDEVDEERGVFARGSHVLVEHRHVELVQAISDPSVQMDYAPRAGPVDQGDQVTADLQVRFLEVEHLEADNFPLHLVGVGVTSQIEHEGGGRQAVLLPEDKHGRRLFRLLGLFSKDADQVAGLRAVLEMHFA
ncbi:hypothetical protein D3C72_2051840 [compost metagenome]